MNLILAKIREQQCFRGKLAFEDTKLLPYRLYLNVYPPIQDFAFVLCFLGQSRTPVPTNSLFYFLLNSLFFIFLLIG